jgi:hypothetical protein
MKKFIILLLVIICSWFLYVELTIYLEKQNDILVNKAIDWKIISHLTNLDEWLKQFEIDKAGYPSKNNINKFLRKYIRINLEYKDFLNEFKFIYEVSDDLKYYKLSANIKDKQKALNDGGIYNEKYELSNKIAYNNYKYKINLWEDNIFEWEIVNTWSLHLESNTNNIFSSWSIDNETYLNGSTWKTLSDNFSSWIIDRISNIMTSNTWKTLDNYFSSWIIDKKSNLKITSTWEILNDNEWKSFSNKKLWFSFKYPKYNIIWWKKYPVKFKIIKNQNKVSIYTDWPKENFPKIGIDYFRIDFHIEDIKNESNINKFIKDYYWDDCMFESLTYDKNNGYYRIGVVWDPKAEGYGEWPVCMLNFARGEYFDKKSKKIIIWYIWQESKFSFTWNEPSYFKTDWDIIHSFRFLEDKNKDSNESSSWIISEYINEEKLKNKDDIKLDYRDYCFYKDECLDKNFKITKSWSIYTRV